MTKDQAVNKAQNVGLFWPGETDEFFKRVEEEAAKMPPSGLWTEDEIAETAAAAASIAAETDNGPYIPPPGRERYEGEADYIRQVVAEGWGKPNEENTEAIQEPGSVVGDDEADAKAIAEWDEQNP